MAESAIQTAVDLLGRGTTFAPPNVDDLLTSVQYDDLEQGTATNAYKTVLAAVQARQTALQSYDGTVLQAAIVMSAGKDTTLSAIGSIVSELNALLSGVGKAKLTSTQETTLMKAIGDAVDAVYKKVTAVAEQNAAMAGSGSSSGSGTDSGGSSGSSADSGSSGSGSSGDGSGSGTSSGSTSSASTGSSSGSGLSSLLPLLMMIPMGLMELAPLVPEFLKRQQDSQHDQQGQGDGQQQPGGPGGQQQPGQPASDATAGDSGAAPAADGPQTGAATPQSGTTQNPSISAPSGNTGQPGTAPQTGATPPTGAPAVPEDPNSRTPKGPNRTPQTTPIPAATGTEEQPDTEDGAENSAVPVYGT
ncbi:hypothetical protein [Nocardia sp. alder85J]|uniref:hypothetical protein n=1 Tax=Nocardia sp. alder85J TaxID=2862949 RepID=UPI001CD2A96D|nr:hypothetical protein [Nocardia sp. alder85J]MCX4092185.1 hypothetical protein [Nocardia sp. alder85J]